MSTPSTWGTPSVRARTMDLFLDLVVETGPHPCTRFDSSRLEHKPRPHSVYRSTVPYSGRHDVHGRHGLRAHDAPRCQPHAAFPRQQGGKPARAGWVWGHRVISHFTHYHTHTGPRVHHLGGDRRGALRALLPAALGGARVMGNGRRRLIDGLIGGLNR